MRIKIEMAEGPIDGSEMQSWSNRVANAGPFGLWSSAGPIRRRPTPGAGAGDASQRQPTDDAGVTGRTGDLISLNHDIRPTTLEQPDPTRASGQQVASAHEFGRDGAANTPGAPATASAMASTRPNAPG
jgi:hypothetical protein